MSVFLLFILNKLKSLILNKASLLIMLWIFSCLGSFYYGRHIAKEVIKGYEGKIVALNNKKQEVQTKIQKEIQTVYKDRIKYIDKVRVVNHTIIQKVPSEIPSLSAGYIYVHNQSALNLPADFNKASDAAPSGISDVAFLDTVDENYGICYTYKAEVQAWRDWYKKTSANYNKKEKIK